MTSKKKKATFSKKDIDATVKAALLLHKTFVGDAFPLKGVIFEQEATGVQVEVLINDDGTWELGERKEPV